MARLALLSVLVIVVLQGVCNGQGKPLMKSIICEGSRSTLSCAGSKVIEMQTAKWGRKDSTTCATNNMATTNCSSNTIWSMVSTMCDGKQKCDLNAQSYFLGDPCPGSSKYLNVTFQCVDCKNAYDLANPSNPMCGYWALQGQCRSNAGWMERNCTKACWKCHDKPMTPIPATCVNKYSDAQCDYWAGLGDCKGSQGPWMAANCTKSCNAACKKPEPACVNVHNDAECDRWADLDECNKNAAYMTINCRKSCYCRNTECTNAYYNKTKCDVWAARGFCSTPEDSAFMLAQCRQSCFKCVPNGRVECRDYWNTTMCQAWAKDGECDSNPGFMISMCTKSCLNCTYFPLCENVAADADCNAWADRGECSANALNAGWMYKNCWKACTDCKGRAPCVDLGNKAQCKIWSKSGECDKNAPFMNSKCTASCTMCQPKPYKHMCENMHTNTTQCDNWATRGDCRTNAPWMLPSCWKSCSKCQ